MRKIHCAFVALALAPVAMAQGVTAEVQARQLSEDRFELVVELPAYLDQQQLWPLLQPAAEQVCGGRSAQQGRISYTANQPVDAGADHGTTTVVQVVECSGPRPEAAGHPAPKTPPSAEDEVAVRERTLAYLEAKDRGDFDAAGEMLGKEAAEFMRADNWSGPRAAFNVASGLPSRRDIVRLSWYDDPAGAPRLGRYVAADYRGDYPHAGFYCGFVVWYLEADGQYRVIREEEGQAMTDTMQGLAPDALAAMRRKVGCRD